MYTDERALLASKLETTLTSRSKPVREAIAQIERTGSLLDDYVVPVKSINFTRDLSDQANVKMNFEYDGHFVSTGIHQHAAGQIGDKFGVPPGYLKTLTYGSNWQRNLAATVMNEHASNIERDRVLIRVVENDARGFLSDKYRRLNNMQIALAFLMGAQATESVLVDAHAGETKGFLEVINPNIVEFDTPLNGRNFACIGARYRNSDFGDGALEVYLFALMVKCMNGLVGQSMLREFHLGGKIPEDIRISDATYQKDTDAKASLVGDIMKQIYLPETTDKLIHKIQGASSKEINLIYEVEKLPKLGLTLTEKDAVGAVLMENNPENGLQGANTLWKLVNGLTAVARDAKPERKRELELIASEMLR